MYTPQELAVYIHWPFCKSKCPYCDFYKELYRNINQDEIISEYLRALQKYHDLTSERQIKSVFFGGGTPSLIEPRNVAKILDSIASLWSVSEQAEISLEANPGSSSKTLFSDLKNAGINRLSLGVQSLNDSDLRFLGRTHSSNDARQCLQEIVEIFPNHSADLIYALPHQTIDDWQKQLLRICSFGLKHISAYELTIEEGTVFARKNICTADTETTLQMAQLTAEILASHNYEHYEISNYAAKSFQSIHNLTYWQGGDYIGIGKSAHGRLSLSNKFFATVYPFEHHELSVVQRAEELILTGLRLTTGINKHTFQQICGFDLSEFVNRQNLSSLKELKLLEEDDNFLRATPQGLSVINEIIRQLCDNS